MGLRSELSVLRLPCTTRRKKFRTNIFRFGKSLFARQKSLFVRQSPIGLGCACGMCPRTKCKWLQGCHFFAENSSLILLSFLSPNVLDFRISFGFIFPLISGVPVTDHSPLGKSPFIGPRKQGKLKSWFWLVQGHKEILRTGWNWNDDFCRTNSDGQHNILTGSYDFFLSLNQLESRENHIKPVLGWLCFLQPMRGDIWRGEWSVTGIPDAREKRKTN